MKPCSVSSWCKYTVLLWHAKKVKPTMIGENSSFLFGVFKKLIPERIRKCAFPGRAGDFYLQCRGDWGTNVFALNHLAV